MAAKWADVTVGQALSVRSLANAKRIGRDLFQRALDDGQFGIFLDSLPVDGVVAELTPPSGGRIHILQAKVILDRDWQKAINAAGPQTPAGYNVRKVGGLYLPTGKGEVEREYILLNNNRAGFAAALVWAKENRLNPTVPQEVFAISEHNHTLHSQLGFNPMWLTATTECEYEGVRQACYVWWHVTGRGAFLDWVERFVHAHVWFAFSRDLA